jgi:hypothetical protein
MDLFGRNVAMVCFLLLHLCLAILCQDKLDFQLEDDMRKYYQPQNRAEARSRNLVNLALSETFKFMNFQVKVVALKVK